MVNEQSQCDHGRIDAMSMVANFLQEYLIDFLGGECMLKTALSGLGKLLAQLQHVVFEAGELVTMHVGWLTTEAG